MDHTSRARLLCGAVLVADSHWPDGSGHTWREVSMTAQIITWTILIVGGIVTVVVVGAGIESLVF